MIRLSALHLVPVLMAAASHAGEITVEQRPFTIEKSFTASDLPGGRSSPSPDRTEGLGGLQILEIAAHGSKVAKGDVLVRFDPESIDKKLRTPAAHSKARPSPRPRPSSTSNTWPKPPRRTGWTPTAAPRRSRRRKTAYFTNTRRKATEEAAAQGLSARSRSLEPTGGTQPTRKNV